MTDINFIKRNIKGCKCLYEKQTLRQVECIPFRSKIGVTLYLLNDNVKIIISNNNV